MKLATNPEGAGVFVDGKKIGETPGFFKIPRHKHGLLRFEKTGGQPLNLELGGHYRWGDAFFSNFIWFFWFAPVGILVDLETDAAWSYDPLGEQKISGLTGVKTLGAQRTIAVSPPQTSSLLLSDEIGDLFYKELSKKYPGDHIIPYKNTMNLFYEYDYTNEAVVAPELRDSLYYELAATHLAQTVVNVSEKETRISGEITDVYSDKVVEKFSVLVPNDDLKTNHRSWFTHFISHGVELVPNTFSFGFKTPFVTFDFDPFFSPYTGTVDRTNGALTYLTSIGLKSARNPKLSDGLKPVFRFVPNFTIDYTSVKFTRAANNDLAGSGFDWYILLAGIGPEVGLDSHVGYFYFQFIPNLGVSYIRGTGNGRDFSTSPASLALQAELGYLVFVSSRINLRLYTNTISGFDHAWGEALSSMAGSRVPVATASEGVTGLAIGYYFPEGRNVVKNSVFGFGH